MTDDLVVIGAGAAGLAAAIFAARRTPGLRIRCVDGARRLGAKILVSGGSRCNVTNRSVTERDFWGGSSRFVRNVLRAFPAERAITFFAQLGVSLHEEEDGKLFPDTNRSRTVLDALLAETARRGVVIEAASRVVAIDHTVDHFAIRLADARQLTARAIVLATGGQSLPKTGSDGLGYQLAVRLGHSIVPTTPGLAPLLIDDDRHAALRGIAHPAALTLRRPGHTPFALDGDWLWTHFGASGPLALNMSRHWHRADVEGVHPDVSLSLCPGERFETLDAWLIEQSRLRPRARLSTVLTARLPAAVADTWIQAVRISDIAVAQVSREDRRRLVHALIAQPLPVRGSRGYQYAEVTAGGVSLDEIDSATLESRLCRGLYLAGEIVDVDGRLGGFNFQWAWASGYVAGTAAAQRLS